MAQFFLLTATNLVCLILVVMNDRSVILRFERVLYGNVRHKASWDTRPGKNNGYVPSEIQEQASLLATEAIKGAKYGTQPVAKPKPRVKKNTAPVSQLRLGI